MNGQKHLQVSMKDSVESMIYAWSELKKYGRLLRWSWTSRGLVTKEEMAQLHPHLSAEELKACDPDAGAPFKEIVPEIPVLVPFLGQVVGV